MARPKRAEVVSTVMISFRLTTDEARRLDQLVHDLGHKDRSALLRAWLAQSGPTAPAPAKTTTAAATNTQEQTGKTTSRHSNRNDERPKQTTPSEEFDVYDFVTSLRAAIQRAKDPHSGWSRIPDVVRTLLPRFAADHIYTVMGLYGKVGYLEFHAKGREPLSREDEVLCPIDAEGTVCTGVRWMGKE